MSDLLRIIDDPEEAKQARLSARKEFEQACYRANIYVAPEYLDHWYGDKDEVVDVSSPMQSVFQQINEGMKAFQSTLGAPRHD